MDLNHERKQKNLENKEINLQKRLQTNNEEMEKIKHVKTKLLAYCK